MKKTIGLPPFLSSNIQIKKSFPSSGIFQTTSRASSILIPLTFQPPQDRMGIILHLLTCLVCIQVILSYPLQEDGSPLYGDYRMGLAKKDSFYPFKESLLSTLGFLENSRGGPQNQRKKAVDSTFIRFGRSSPSEANLRSDVSQVIPKEQDMSSDDSKSSTSQQFILDHKGCRISSSRELVRALMNDRNCIRAFQKVKRENVNDTFIRFGKRSVPSEEDMESRNSNKGV